MSTASVFDRLYERYDQWYLRHQSLAYSELLTVSKALEGLSGPCVEIGVGTGWFASRLGCDLGVDPSFNMLRVARSRGLEVVVGVGESLPLGTGRFSTVLMVVTLCFVDDPVSVFRESSRILADGGSLVACIVPRDSPWGEYYLQLSSMNHPFYRIARFYTVEEVDELAAGLGLRRTHAYATLTYPPGVERVEEPRAYQGGEGFVCLRYSRK
ncbi:MAG: class I SAM-dependent methyltransferase [Desulfurococcales archaeon]|nr:class I SAM-dependent methyltransferase [Desulfurococcales archaeon]